MILDKFLSVINNEKLWQVLLIFITVYVTSKVTYYFQTEKDNRKELREYISSLSRTGLLLDKALYLWYEFNISASYYESRNLISPHDDLWEEHKRMIREIPNKSEKVYELYGDVRYFMKQIQKITDTKHADRLDEFTNDILNDFQDNLKYSRELRINNLEELEKWREDSIKKIKEVLKANITLKFGNLDKYLKSIIK